MRKSTLEKYQGSYQIIKEPRSLKDHNLESWLKISRLINSKSSQTASFDELSSIVKGHLHYGEYNENPYKFVLYCINSGWLSKSMQNTLA